MKLVTPELNLRKDPGNVLDEMRSKVDIDSDFFAMVFCLMDPFDLTSVKDLSNMRKYFQIILDSPEIYERQSEQEVTREEQRIFTHRQLLHYFREAQKIHPMAEVLTDIKKFAQFCNPIANFNEDIGVKFTVSL